MNFSKRISLSHMHIHKRQHGLEKKKGQRKKHPLFREEIRMGYKKKMVSGVIGTQRR
jgi:hypothetical protein